MLIIRLTRRGRRNDPSFRLVVTEKSNPVKGKFLEELGFYNPKLKTKNLKQERILYWIKQGAKCSGTVNNFLINSGVIQGEKVKVWRPKKKEGGAEAVKPEVKTEKAEEVKAEAPTEEKKEEAVAEAAKPDEEPEV